MTNRDQSATLSALSGRSAASALLRGTLQIIVTRTVPKQYEALHLRKATQREFKADGEQQKHDSDLGQLLDRFNIFYQSESVRTDRDSRQHQSDKQR